MSVTEDFRAKLSVWSARGEEWPNYPIIQRLLSALEEKDKEIFDLQGHIDCFKSERDFQVKRCQEKDEEIERLKNRGGNLQYDNHDLIELLKDVVNQACWVMEPTSREWYLNAMALSAYEGAIKWLVENGHAVWIKKGYTARWKE